MNDTSFRISQGFEVLQPRSGKAYPVPCDEWNFLKHKIEDLSFRNELHNDAGWALLGITLSTFVSILLNAGAYSQAALIIAWAVVAVTLLSGILCLYFASALKKIKKTQASEILTQMEIIENRYQDRSYLRGKDQKLIFQDNFDEFVGWASYRDGNVSPSTEQAHIGACSLKKEHANDPNGGYKQIGKNIELGFILSGWIYSPANREGGQADRLAIEDHNFNGYGFAVVRDKNIIYLARRDNGGEKRLGQRIPFDSPSNQWYQFKFYARTDGQFQLWLYDSFGNELKHTPWVPETEKQYNTFDRVVVHGGYPYYVDELKLEAL